MEVEEGGIPHDDKAKRMRDLLSSFYSPDHSSSRSSSLPRNTSSRFATLDTINTITFDADQYMNLLGKVYSDSESIQARAEAVILLKQLDFPVENLKVKLFEKLEQFLMDLHLESKEISNASVDANESSDRESLPDSTSATAHEASICEFAEAVRAYKVIFLHSETQLFKLAQDLVIKHFAGTRQQIKKQIHSADLLSILRVIWTDVLLMDEVLPEASLRDFALQSARVAVKDYISSVFRRLLLDISAALTSDQVTQNEVTEEKYSLEAAFEASKKAVTQGSMDILLEFRKLLDGNQELLLKLRELTINWVQEGFQDFFRKLNDYFLLLSGKSNAANQDLDFIEGIPGDKIDVGLVLVLAQLCPLIAQEIASSFSSGGAQEYGPVFLPAEISRIFLSSGETFLHLYIKMRAQKISVLLKKRFTAPNWVKFEEITTEVKKILPQGLQRKHRRADSNGSTNSSRSNPLRDDRLSRSNTQKARSHFLETHLAKLFKQKTEIFTKIEHTQESVITTIVTLSLKSLQEFVRLHTFNRSGFQQIQLDIYYLKATLKDIDVDEAAVDILLDEVIIGTAERCLDPTPLEPPVLDKLVQAKLAKASEQSQVS
ncbi:hypothetical protein RD792_003450 [Penstemon davidsonii]|uniref:Vacuolar protein sorting-associated protein 51 homolog n=1 Tax=Penstemon davidsonii TaxID=160366 RepID=A0ABR0DTU8_9LAMI|nr:hypothetical protein RD792_003450 [Penstemon davidsonii]